MNQATFLMLMTCVCLPACGGEDEPNDDPTADKLEIAGAWESNFMSTEVIDDASWSVDFGSGPASSEIVEFSNENNDAVLLGADGTYGRNVWTEISDDSFYYCMVSFGHASAADAVAQSEPADDSDPATDGCGSGNFSWTMLARQ